MTQVINTPRACPNGGATHIWGNWHYIFNKEGKTLGVICFICGCFVNADGEVWVRKKRKPDLDIEPIIWEKESDIPSKAEQK